jgi:hypothetical protein
VILSTLGLPANATFVDNANSTGRFAFRPDASQVGVVSVTFLGVDQGTPQLSTTYPVDITVVTENLPPILDPVGPRTITEGQTLTINLTASDPDGPPPAIQAVGAPEGSNLVDNGDGTAVFTFTPDYYGKQRLVSVTFRAYDGFAIDKELVLIQVYDAGNQAPYFDSIPAPTLVEGETVIQGITAKDPDRDPMTLSIDEAAMPLPQNASFLDLGLGAGAITFAPDFCQAGTYDVYVVVSDGELADTIVITFDVTEFGNHAPVISAIGDRTVAEADTLTFAVGTSDVDCETATLWAVGLPTNATFVDNANGSGSFTFLPDYEQAGTYDVMFYASDGVDTTSQLVTITVTDTNRLPFIFTDNGRTIYEADTLIYEVSGWDADGTTPTLSAHLSGLDTLATNMTFTDNHDGTGTLVFMPSYTQGGPVSNPTRYYLVFRATDEVYTDVSQSSETITISVIDRNQPPELVFPLPGGPGPYTINEGGSVSFFVAVIDPDWITRPIIRAENMPSANASFTYNPVSFIGQFQFFPDFTQAGVYLVRFIATDDRAATDTGIVQITVLEAGNQPPSFGTDRPDTLMVPTNHLYEIIVAPQDPEHDSITVEVYPMLPGASWTDLGNGTWIYSFTAGSTEVGSVYEITFVVTDYPSMATDTLVVHPRIVAFLRGDLDADNMYSVNDIAYLVEFLFRDGPAPAIEEAGDVDANGRVTISDVSYLVYYMFRNGPQPAP